MKTISLDLVEDFDFYVLAINSHTKAYRLCWSINKSLNLSFEKQKYHQINDFLWFANYTAVCENGAQYTLISNRSKNGYLIPTQKNINFFLLVKNNFWNQEKKMFIRKLKNTKEILLVVEVDAKTIKKIDRLIIHDKKD